jgi:hypothetical protein
MRIPPNASHIRAVQKILQTEDEQKETARLAEQQKPLDLDWALKPTKYSKLIRQKPLPVWDRPMSALRDRIRFRTDPSWIGSVDPKKPLPWAVRFPNHAEERTPRALTAREKGFDVRSALNEQIIPTTNEEYIRLYRQTLTPRQLKQVLASQLAKNQRRTDTVMDESLDRAEQLLRAQWSHVPLTYRPASPHILNCQAPSVPP